LPTQKPISNGVPGTDIFFLNSSAGMRSDKSLCACCKVSSRSGVADEGGYANKFAAQPVEEEIEDQQAEKRLRFAAAGREVEKGGSVFVKS